LFDDLPTELPVWMSHGDTILEAPPGFRRLAESENSTIAAMADESGRFGIAFHPEVIHTPQGREILRNFLYQVAGCRGSSTPATRSSRRSGGSWIRRRSAGESAPPLSMSSNARRPHCPVSTSWHRERSIPT